MTSEESMLKLLSYMIGHGVATQKKLCPPMDEEARCLPYLTESPCQGSDCNACADLCPTTAITVRNDEGKGKVALDLGACIACGLCSEICPTETIVENRSTEIARLKREELVLTNHKAAVQAKKLEGKDNIFGNSVQARVVSTGCSACDAEIGASGNPVFDIERFGVHIVASPRFADVLMVTGPVAKSMQEPTKLCYQQMPEPKLVMAVGTCAISGGVHRGTYTDAKGVDNILPVDVYIPGCPPHPWSIVHGVLLAMGRAEIGPPVLKTKKKTE